jgi:hypothetical protein
MATGTAQGGRPAFEEVSTTFLGAEILNTQG